MVFPHTYSDEAYVKYLRSKGAKIGYNTRFIYPRKCHVDIHRAEYITIGDNCCLSQVRILAHDYSWYVALDSDNKLIPDPGGEVIIGNNVFVGYESLILKNSIIGDNVIIGARSVVTGITIPSNTVWAGAPARFICSLEEYIKKKEDNLSKSLQIRKNILERRSSYCMEDWGYFMFLFLPRTEENYNKYIKQLEYNGKRNSSVVRDHFFSTTPMWSDYESFLNEINYV